MPPTSRLRSRAAADRPAPSRTLRSRWRDPRLAGGLVLIGASVAVGAWAVDAAADTQDLYALTADVAPGDSLTADGVLTLVSSHPGTGDYVTADELPDGAVATRSMKAGELLPQAAVSTESTSDTRSVVLDIASGLPEGTGTGDVVDLWTLPSASITAKTGETDASLVAEQLVVARVGEAGNDLVGARTTSVEVLVPRSRVSQVLTAVASEGSLVLVPTGEGA